MWEWLIGIVAVAIILGMFLLFGRLIKNAQDRDAGKRGQDSSSPGNYYSDLGG